MFDYSNKQVKNTKLLVLSNVLFAQYFAQICHTFTLILSYNIQIIACYFFIAFVYIASCVKKRRSLEVQWKLPNTFVDDLLLRATFKTVHHQWLREQSEKPVELAFNGLSSTASRVHCYWLANVVSFAKM